MKLITALSALMLVASPAVANERPNPLQPSESWDALQSLLIEDRQVSDADGLFSVAAPYRAADAATVPVVIEQTDPEAVIKAAMVVVDENPAPLAAELTFEPAMYPIAFEMRLRVDQYSNVRVLAETADGLRMDGRFVKASGGCSAPASRDPEIALASMGEMRMKEFAADGVAQMNTPRREAQIMIRHPNYSGLQRDQVTHLFINAHFIDRIEVFQGDEALWSMSGGISLSENPVFRFSYVDNGSTDLRVRASDTEGNVFEQVLSKSVTG